MTLSILSAACLPFGGRDGRSYCMNEEGQLVRVNFKEAGSREIWASLIPGQRPALPADAMTDELRLALSRLAAGGGDTPASPPDVPIFGDDGLSAVAGSALSLSDIRCRTVGDPRQAGPCSDCLLVAAGYFRTGLFRQAEEAFRATGVPWAPFYLDGKQVRFGPCMGPYLTLKDLTARLLSASSAPDALRDLWRRADTLRYPGLPFSLSEQRWLFASVALLLEDWRRGGREGLPPERYQWTFRPASREVAAHPVLRLPSSPAVPERRASR